MVLKNSKKNAEHPTISSQPSISEKKTPNSLKNKAKRMKKRLRKLSETEGSSLGQIAKKDEKSENSTAANVINQNASRNEKVKGSFKGNQNNNRSKKFELKQAEASNSERKLGGGSQSQVASKNMDRTTAKVEDETNQNTSKKGNPKKENRGKDELVSVEASNSEQKLGGLIFMCNAKTKSDCFHYKIMALPYTKKDVVLGIKPGLKLFLYDFDLKLLYGIFEASSAGGMKLEPAAFGGAFPAQVRFRICKDCLPIPESVFKNAIEANYDKRTNKFKTELTSKQVRKLRLLFRPIRQPHLLPAPSSDPLFITEEEYRSNGLRLGLHGQPYSAPDDISGKSVQEYRSSSSFQDQAVGSEHFFLTENEYRMYGLRGPSNNASLIPATTSQPSEYRSDSNNYVTPSRPFSSLIGGPTYGSHLESTVTEAYHSDLRSSSYSVDYHLPGRVVDEGLYTSSYLPRDQNEYHQRSDDGGQSELSSAPVSSRYSFAGALYSLR